MCISMYSRYSSTPTKLLACQFFLLPKIRIRIRSRNFGSDQKIRIRPDPDPTRSGSATLLLSRELATLPSKNIVKGGKLRNAILGILHHFNSHGILTAFGPQIHFLNENRKILNWCFWAWYFKSCKVVLWY
jgi:hypothetical protein